MATLAVHIPCGIPSRTTQRIFPWLGRHHFAPRVLPSTVAVKRAPVSNHTSTSVTEQGWISHRWTATRRDDGRIYGRGAADDKGDLVVHLGTLKVFDGKPPCTVKLIVEGMEETDSNLEAFVAANPELFACDVFVVCDMGNLRVGQPTLTTTLRGEVDCVVTVRTLAHPLHSGEFGGAAPDAMMALARLLASLHDEAGNVAVEGVSSFAWDGADLAAEEFRAGADLPEGVRLTGAGPVGGRLWSSPSVSAIGIDAPSIAGSSNVLIPQARAKLSMRIVPGSDPQRELDALAGHLASHAPLGCAGAGRAGRCGAWVPLPDRRSRARRGAARAAAGVRDAVRVDEPATAVALAIILLLSVALDFGWKRIRGGRIPSR